MSESQLESGPRVRYRRNMICKNEIVAPKKKVDTTTNRTESALGGTGAVGYAETRLIVIEELRASSHAYPDASKKGMDRTKPRLQSCLTPSFKRSCRPVDPSFSGGKMIIFVGSVRSPSWDGP